MYILYNLCNIKSIMDSNENIKTFKQIGKESLKLLKDTENTINHNMRSYIHSKWPNVPIAKLAITAKVVGVCSTMIVGYYTLKGKNKS